MDIAAQIALRLAYRKRNENQINSPQSMLQEAIKKVGNTYKNSVCFPCFKRLYNENERAERFMKSKSSHDYDLNTLKLYT